MSLEGEVQVERETASRTELRQLFEQGAVYADRWTLDVRKALDVPDPLTDVVVDALSHGRTVILSGNAGDGKSHLAQAALDQLGPRRYIEVTRESRVPRPVPEGCLVFIRDASALSDGEVLEAVAAARAAGVPLLLTINEGPLSSLAGVEETSFFGNVRSLLHSRANGEPTSEEGDLNQDLLVVNLAGRQLTRSAFVSGALARLLPVVGPCRTCGKSATCPRVVGAKLLRKSRRAQQRLEELLRLLSDGGRHLSAREVWVFLIDLFFGWTCPPLASEVDKASGFFWTRVFESSNACSESIASEFDPLTIPMAREDVLIWQGDFDRLSVEAAYPGSRPSALARESEEWGLAAFASAKRCYFFFAKGLDSAEMLAQRSRAPLFGQMLEKGLNDSRPVVREVVGVINAYRLNRDTENDLWISRHHGFAAHRRPSALGAAAKLPIDALQLRVPYSYEASRYADSGFFPTKVFLCWRESNQYLPIDFATWERLQQNRTLTVDRQQETLDFALDLFLSQAPVPATGDPEIHIYDHRRQEQTMLRIRPESRKIEVIA